MATISWKQYSGSENSRIFLVSSGQIPVLSGMKWPETFHNFPIRNTASISIDFSALSDGER
jgi:hypothetical protein